MIFLTARYKATLLSISTSLESFLTLVLVTLFLFFSLMPTPLFAQSTDAKVFSRKTERVIPGDVSIPLVLQVGTDLGHLSHSPSNTNSGPFSGTLMTGKVLGSLLFSDWILETGAGWSYSAIYGQTRADNPLETPLYHRIYTQSAFAEGGLRWRLTPKFHLGLIAQHFFGTDQSLSPTASKTNQMLLGGCLMAVDLLSESGIFRLGASLLGEVLNNNRKVLLYGLTLQFGIPLRGYDILLKKTDVVIRSEKVQRFEVPRVTTQKIVRDVSKYTLPRNTFHFSHGQSFLIPEDQRFLHEVAEILKKHENNYKTVTIETQIRATGSKRNDLRISEERAQTIRNALVTLGLSPQKVLAAGQGGRQIQADNFGDRYHLTLVDLSFADLSEAEVITDSLNNLIKRRVTPDTCAGEKCR